MTRRWGVTEQEELEVLQRWLPVLFDGGDGELLYVGANQLRPPHHVQTLVDSGWHVHLLEVFLGNVQHHQGGGLFDSLTWGDVRTARFPQNSVDVAMWWHGCEHIPQADVAQAVANLERAAAWLVVLGCPNGNSPQGAEYGNEQETHRWDVSPSDLQALGYGVVAYAAGGHRRHLLAWKVME